MYIVTGANGFIGSAMVWELNKAGYSDILCSDSVDLNNRPELLSSLKYTNFFSTDELLEKLQSSDILKNCKAVIHMGACSSTTETNKEFLESNNTNYTKKLFELCSTFQVPFIYASSGAVYGDGAKGFNDNEDSRMFKPLNLYGWSKVNFDTWVVTQTKTPPTWYGLRFFNVFGPNEYHKGPMSSLVYKAFNQIRENGSLKLFRSYHPNYKDGEQMRDFVYVKDITRWMLELSQKKNKQNSKPQSGIYNMGYGQARTWIDLAKAVFSNMNKELNIQWIEIPDNLKNQYQYYTKADISKLEKQGLSLPQWSLEESIKDYLQNYLLTENPYLRLT